MSAIRLLGSGLLLLGLLACGAAPPPTDGGDPPVTSPVDPAPAAATADPEPVVLTEELVQTYLRVFPQTARIARDRERSLPDRSAAIEQALAAEGWNLATYQAVTTRVGHAMGWVTLIDMKIAPPEMMAEEEAKLAGYSDQEKELLRQHAGALLQAATQTITP